MAVFFGSDVLTNSAAHRVGTKKRFQQEASESSAMVALLLLRWLCMLLSVYGSHFSTRAELRDALLQRLGFLPRRPGAARVASRTRSERRWEINAARLMEKSASRVKCFRLHSLLWERLKAS